MARADLTMDLRSVCESHVFLPANVTSLLGIHAGPCVVCLGAKARIPSFFCCVHFAPGKLSERQLHLSGSQMDMVDMVEGMETGEPYLLPQPPDPLWDWKLVLRFLPPGEAARRFTCLPPRISLWVAFLRSGARAAVILRFQSRCCWGTMAIEFTWIAHGSGRRVGNEHALSPPAFPRSNALVRDWKPALRYFPFEWELTAAVQHCRGDACITVNLG